jgi:UDP-N-acetylmuramoyl-tripeptide--D-alanyl-D-alanine ligase
MDDQTETDSSLHSTLPPLTAIRIALLMLSPFEHSVRRYIYAQAKAKLTTHQNAGLKVIAVAGSYAKTSTKHILAHALSQQDSVLITPKSVNTLLGISEVIRHSLSKQHKIFIVELGEYHPQDIPALVRFVEPDLGILTPIGRQHLEIIGGIENIVKSLTHFVQFFTDPKKVLLHEINRQYFTDFQGVFYGVSESSQLRVDQTKVTRAGTEYTIIDSLNNQSHSAFIPLFGEHQAVNTLSAVWAAQQLDIDQTAMLKKLSTLPYIHRRHEPTFADNNVLILDNSYNTNPDSVQESLKLVNQLSPSKRFIVTLGFTELGDESDKIHFEYGKTLANQMDYVGLIKAPWSDKIVDGFTSAGGLKDHILIGHSQEDAFAQIQPFVVPNSVILFEGGYREVYV